MEDTILVTKRLLLRYQRKSDINFLVNLWMDEEMTKYTGGSRNKTDLIEEFKRIASEPRKEEYDVWPVELKKSHDLIGYAGFIPKEVNGKGYIELNYYIEKKHWGKGYATEIAKKLIEYGIEIKGLKQIVAIIDPENDASKEVAKKSGMKYWINEERSGKKKSIYIIRRKEI